MFTICLPPVADDLVTDGEAAKNQAAMRGPVTFAHNMLACLIELRDLRKPKDRRLVFFG
jgi:hypothetical protein